MLELIGNKIILTKGDFASFNLSIYYADMKNLYELKDGDSLRFYLSKKNEFNGKFKTYINKLLNKYYFELQSIDTIYLESGVYQYEIELIFEDRNSYTVIGPCIMELKDSLENCNIGIPTLKNNSLFNGYNSQIQLIGKLNIGLKDNFIENINLNDLKDVNLNQEEYGDILMYQNEKWTNSNMKEIINDTLLVIDGGEV